MSYTRSGNTEAEDTLKTYSCARRRTSEFASPLLTTYVQRQEPGMLLNTTWEATALGDERAEQQQARLHDSVTFVDKVHCQGIRAQDLEPKNP